MVALVDTAPRSHFSITSSPFDGVLDLFSNSSQADQNSPRALASIVVKIEKRPSGGTSERSPQLDCRLLVEVMVKVSRTSEIARYVAEGATVNRFGVRCSFRWASDLSHSDTASSSFDATPGAETVREGGIFVDDVEAGVESREEREEEGMLWVVEATAR